MESKIDLLDIYKELKRIQKTMATKEELNQIIETIAILSDEETMVQIAESEKNIENRDFREISSADDL